MWSMIFGTVISLATMRIMRQNFSRRWFICHKQYLYIESSFVHNIIHIQNNVRGIDTNVWNIPHIQPEMLKYSIEYWQSRRRLLWIWIMSCSSVAINVYLVMTLEILVMLWTSFQKLVNYCLSITNKLCWVLCGHSTKKSNYIWEVHDNSHR